MRTEVAMPTNAASSGVTLDRKTLKSIARRADRPGLVYLAQCGFGLLTTGALVWLSFGTVWLWPAMFVHGVLLTVPAYAMSHETAHGTAFRSRRLNETVLWLTSLVYMEEPLHRRYTHTNHHSFTWYVGKDSQMPFDTPMALGGWLAEVSGFVLLCYHATVMLRLAAGRYLRRCGEPAALQALGVERGAEPVMPENLDEVAFASAEYEEIARMRIPPETLLDLKRQGVHPAPHVRHAGRKPDPRSARNRDHRRSRTPRTRDSAVTSTSRSTVTREPSARAISIRPERDGSISGGAGRSVAGSVSSVDETTTGTKPPTTRASSRYWRRQSKTWFAFTSCRRATTDTETPG